MDIRNFFGAPSSSSSAKKQKKNDKDSKDNAANSKHHKSKSSASPSLSVTKVTAEGKKTKEENDNHMNVDDSNDNSSNNDDNNQELQTILRVDGVRKKRKHNSTSSSESNSDSDYVFIPKNKNRNNMDMDDDNDSNHDVDKNNSDDYSHDKHSDNDNDKLKKRKVSPTKSSIISTPTNKKKQNTKTSNSSIKSTPKQSKASSTNKSKPTKFLQKPPQPIPSYNISQIQNKQCFSNLTFVITGILPNISREDMIDYIKILGGRVTTSVSSKTNYLIVGDILEDGRVVESGSKYKKATELGEDCICILNEGEVYALAQMLDDDHKNTKSDCNIENGNEKEQNEEMKVNTTTTETSPSPNAAPIVNPYAKKASNNNIVNPYAKTTNTSVVNPYAKPTTPISNPYAKAATTTTTTTTSNPYAKSTTIQNPYAKSTNNSSTQHQPSSATAFNGGGRADVNDTNALWADKYAPNHSSKILGNGEIVKKLKQWLNSWEQNFLTGKKRSFNPKTGPFKAALLSGPPGIGKTTTAILVATEANRQVLELNASDTRSKTSLQSSLGDVTGSHVLSFNDSSSSYSSTSATSSTPKQRCVIMDEVDGMGSGDRSGMSELIKMIKSSKVPIICICNDRQNQKIKSLVPYCLDLKYRRPIKTAIAKRAVEVGAAEGMMIESNAAEALAESCGNDIRQVLNCLQMWGSKRHDSTSTVGERVNMTYQDFKDRNNFVNKDEILRVSLFDATRTIVEGRKGLASVTDPIKEKDHLFNRTDAFYVDYNFMGLMVHQNYLKVVNQKFQQTKIKSDVQGELQCLRDMYSGTECMSDFAIADDSLRSEQHWGLLPLCSVLTAKCGYHAGGESGGILTSYPEFSTWFGKNSSRGKKSRIIQELSHHINYKISADTTELRLGYLPALRNRLSTLLMAKEGPYVSEAIDFMDEYGLDRDDVFENIDEFTMDRNVTKFTDLDSKVKAAFTREYNKVVHKSQALVDEQGVTSRKKRSIKSSDSEIGDEIDGASDDEEEEDDKMNMEELKKAFQKSKKAATAAAKKQGNAKNGKKSTKKKK